jgi:hypothetical protein
MDSKTAELKALKILYFALLAGQIGMGMIVCFVVSRGFSNAPLRSKTYILLIVAAFLSIGGLAVGYTLFRKRLDRLRILTDLPMKIRDYRAACILKWALFEGPCLFALICYQITLQAAFLAVAGLLILNFLNNYPSGRRVAQDLELSRQEEENFAT